MQTRLTEVPPVQALTLQAHMVGTKHHFIHPSSYPDTGEQGESESDYKPFQLFQYPHYAL